SGLHQGKAVPGLAIPLRAGDSIIVPAAGEVFVDGWVNKPGAITLSRAMTVTQAIATAGGIHFAGASGGIVLRRTGLRGEVAGIPVDYAAIIDGRTPDVVLETGDRIEVGSNPLKVAPWGVYGFVKSIFSFGVGGNVGTSGVR
ncbi:MAG: SLBB domain-containing protein, partial [Candidatus Binatia bacterium]